VHLHLLPAGHAGLNGLVVKVPAEHWKEIILILKNTNLRVQGNSLSMYAGTL
jgi:hypothetical protein